MARRADARYGISVDAEDSIRSIRRVQRGFRDLTRFAAPVTAAFTAAAGAAAYFTVQSIRANSELAKTARQTGASAEMLSEMRGALSLIGGNFDQFTRALDVANRRFGELEDGATGAEEAFGKLGITAADIRDLTTDERVELLIRRFAELEDATERSAVAQRLFPDSYRTWLRLADTGVDTLNELREAQRRLGLSRTGDELRQAEAAEDAWTRLGQTIRGVKEEAAAEAVPAVALVINQATDALQAALGRLDESRADTFGARTGAAFARLAPSPSQLLTAGTLGAPGSIAETLLREILGEIRRSREATEEAVRLEDRRLTGQFGSSFE